MDIGIENTLLDSLNRQIKLVVDHKEERTRDYELMLSAIADDKIYKLDSGNFEKTLRYIIQNGESDKVSYGAFYILAVYLRRRSRFAELGDLFARYRSAFEKHETFKKCELMALEAEGLPGNLRSIILRARAVAKRQQDSAGSMHLYSIVVATAAEKDSSKVPRMYINEAIECCSKAIEMDDDYAKFYATSARLHLLVGELDIAFEQISNAFALENPNSDMYAKRLSDYEMVRSKIMFKRQEVELASVATKIHGELDATYENVKGELNQQSSKAVELVAFFAGVLALVTTGVNLGKDRHFLEAGLLLVVLAGVLILSFSCLAVLFKLGGEKPWIEQRAIVVVSLIASVIMIGGGLVAGWCLFGPKPLLH